MSFLNFFRRSETTESKSSIGAAQMLIGKDHSYGMTDWKSYAKEGYGGNPTVFACINLIARAFGRVPLKVKDENGEHLPDSAFQQLMNRPNLDEGDVEFRMGAIAWYVLTGNNFTERILTQGVPSELYLWQPYDFSIGRIKGSRIPARYIWRKNAVGQKSWDMNLVTGQSDMHHWRSFNPKVDDGSFGQSFLQAGARNADTYNATTKWRYNTAKNGNTMDGILSPKGGATMDDKQRKGLERSLNEKFKGATQSGRKIGLSSTEMTYTAMTVSAREAEFVQGTKLNKSEICEVFGVPSQLIGVEGSNTYANYEQANLAFYHQTIIPLLDLYCSEMNRWLGDFYPSQKLSFDLSDIGALEPERAERRKQKIDSGVYTINEIRQEFGDAPVDEPDADVIMTDPNKLPLGMDVFGPSEMAGSAVAKALILSGMTRDQAESKALEWLHDRKD